MFTAANIQKLR